MKAVIIDFSCSGEIKILNTKITSNVNIISGYFMTVNPEDDLAKSAAQKLSDEGLSGTACYIIPPNDLMSNHVFNFPKMPDKEIEKILPRELAGVADSSEEMVFNYIHNGIIEDRQVEKLEIATFYCTKEKMFGFLNRMKEEGLKPVSLIPEAQALKTLAESNPDLSPERTGVAFIDLMGTHINLSIFKDNHWSLERDFMFRLDHNTGGEEADLNDDDFTRISTELNRTFQYFKQKNRGYNIDQALIYGSSKNIEALKNQVNDNHPLTASLILPEHFTSKTTFPAHLKDSREFLSIFTLSIATALSVCNKDYLDLFPTEYKERARRPARLIVMGVAAVILIGALIVGTVYFENIKAGYKEDIKKIQKTYDELTVNASSISRTKQQRAEYFTRRFYIDFPVKYSYSAADFIRRLSLVTTSEVELVHLEVMPGNQSFTFKLDGRIKAEDNIRAQSRFLRFYQRIKVFENMIDAKSSNVAVNPGINDNNPQNPSNPNKTDEKKEVVLNFSISGEVDTEQ